MAERRVRSGATAERRVRSRATAERRVRTERAATRPTPAPGVRADRWVPWAVATAAATVYTTFAVTQWRLLESPSWDLGIFTQLAQAYARGEAPVVPIKGAGFNLLGDHFHPLLVVLGPLYRLFPSGLTLLITQAVLLALSAVPLTAVARELLGRARGTVLGVAYGFSWGLQGAVAAQFHEIALAVPLLTSALAAFLRGRWAAAALWASPLVFVKEDLGLTVAALGAVMLWRDRVPSLGRGETQPADGGPGAGWAERRPGRRRWVGGGLLTWGLGWTVLTITVILPAVNPAGRWDYYGRLDDPTGGGPVATLLGALTPGEKYVTVLLLVAAAGVVGLRSPLAWLWVPTLTWRFLGNVEFYWGWGWHYSAILMPVAAAALIDAVAPPQPRADRARGADTGALTAPGTPRSERGLPDRARPAPGGWASIAVAVAAATTVLMTPVQPLARLTDAQTYALPDRHPAAMAALDAVRPGARVETDIYLMAYLVPRAEVYWVGNEGNPTPDYLVLDTTGRTWPDRTVTDAAALAAERHPGTSWELVLNEAGYQVARRLG